jgi:hypothetical protein
VLLEEVDGEEVVVRVQATPDRPDDGAQLADEVIAALSTVTGEHPVVSDREPPAAEDGNGREHQEAGAAAGRHWTPGGPEDVTTN